MGNTTAFSEIIGLHNISTSTLSGLPPLTYNGTYQKTIPPIKVNKKYSCLSLDPIMIKRNVSEMRAMKIVNTLPDWIELLEPDEKGYVRQCFRYWQGTNGNIIPTPPPGMSKARADVLLYHVKSLNNDRRGRRKVEESKPLSIRMTDALKHELAFEAAEMDLNLSEYLIRCINAGRSTVQAFPDNEFKNPVIQK